MFYNLKCLQRRKRLDLFCYTRFQQNFTTICIIYQKLFMHQQIRITIFCIKIKDLHVKLSDVSIGGLDANDRVVNERPSIVIKAYNSLNLYKTPL